MHGRLKVKSTAEQQEAKRKEREKKLQIYNAATSKIFSKKKDGELDEELLHLCGEVLAANPDFYTLWNYRKEVFLELRKSKSPTELQNLFLAELFFLESCLRMNPKSYGTWHHRCFVMDTMPDPDWLRELELCNQFLKYDERNFHCWDYRRFIVKRANVSPEAELDFSMSKISNNFSNYSSWHYRSKLLPLIHPDSGQPMGVSEDALLKEYELVQNGFFTDPDDQSNWFYHRWLMGRGELKQAVNSVSVFQPEGRISVSFLRHVQVGKSASISLECDGSPLKNIKWLNHENKEGHSTLWITFFLFIPFRLIGVILPIAESWTLDVQLVINNLSVCSAQIQVLAEEKNSRKRWVPSGLSSRFSQEMSSVKAETLQQELEAITQLMEVETDNKWAVLTAVLLMKALDPQKHEAEIMVNLDKLQALDFKRVEYYKDLRSRFIVEAAIDAMDRESSSLATTLSLPHRGLTKLYHSELLTLLTSLNLSDNQLRDVRQFGFLQSLRELDLSNNCLTTCHGLQNLPCLEKVVLSNNQLSSPESLATLQTCPYLKQLHLVGNPVVEQEAGLEGIKEILPGVEIITQSSS
ncbi:hypothetical protein RRG08_028213 [Elysia crispata]|uniref:Geranylgeranyl transferase type-2 subunit alpha n=1 Tax=Elysia crispata TaxID=231223 RepID=A0AAE0YBD6_9GAST|nr:hypothetical protein RRG08_028213 [Elysia crispata]